MKHYRVEFKLQGYCVVPVSRPSNQTAKAYSVATRELNEALGQILRSGKRQISELHWDTTIFEAFEVKL